ncbi:hypothetical protein NC796_06635 [Aliifodinibius sp. S!AR15-10]|uniref:hypothetical protein n=1 Tax=Aliifodinibius sp. S!AR15-10 TaxID=2950437 RepID=UPI002862BA6D|nr:hypothetical protein [Aliifodinibius sp. S!AR15-10]MDR8390805.1 hypothetical protein [Aliifodinibius sp. S!AR15-10]
MPLDVRTCVPRLLTVLVLGLRITVVLGSDMRRSLVMFSVLFTGSRVTATRLVPIVLRPYRPSVTLRDFG